MKEKFKYITEVDTDTLPSGRTYHTPDGSYPSITTILGKTSDQTWLQKWKETSRRRRSRTGFQRSDRSRHFSSRICRTSFQRGRRMGRINASEARRKANES